MMSHKVFVFIFLLVEPAPANAPAMPATSKLKLRTVAIPKMAGLLIAWGLINEPKKSLDYEERRRVLANIFYFYKLILAIYFTLFY